MKNKNVHLKYSITIPKDLKINVFDLNIILGNLLNNAIEAIVACQAKRKKVTRKTQKTALIYPIYGNQSGFSYVI